MTPSTKADTNQDIVRELAIVSTTMGITVETLKRVTSTVFGNGKTGLVELTAQNQRDIIALQQVIKEHLEMEKARAEELAKTKKESRADMRRMWISIVLLLMTTVMTIVQAILLSRLL